MIKPYSGTFGKTELLHLLRRTLFGVSPSDMKYFEGKSLNEVVDLLLDIPNTPPSPPIRTYQGRATTPYDSLVPFGETWVGKKIISSEPNPEGNRRNSYRQWWTQLIINQDRNLREKMVMFWHNHVVTDTSDTVNYADLAYKYNVLLRGQCIGNFKKIINDITYDGAMLRYLNGEKNKVGAPDENYGRELQELFCCGKGPDSKYTEEDVQVAARVLTGWVIEYNNDFKVSYQPNRHDKTDKKFSSFYGNKIIKYDSSANGGANEITEMINMIFENQETARYMARRFFTFFVYYEINDDVESNVILPLADLFRSSGYEVKPLLKALLTSEYFFKSDYRGAMIKSPADYTLGMSRQMEIDWPSDPMAFEARYYFASQLYGSVRNQGQEIGDPPSVAGWPAYYQTPSYYELWVDTATYPPRLSTNDTLTAKNYNTGNATNPAYLNSASRGKVFKIDGPTFIAKLNSPSDPNKLIEELVLYFYGSAISKPILESLKTTFLLKGQTTDYYWTDAYNNYLANPANPSGDGKNVPKQLQDLFVYMFSAAEYHLH